MPTEMVRQAQREEPFEVFAKLQQFAETTFQQWPIIGTHDEIATDDQAAIQTEFGVGLDMAVGVMFMVELRTGEREVQVAQRQTMGGLARPGATCEFFTRVSVYR